MNARLALLLFFAAGSAAAQTSTATLTGIVTDATQARLPGVTLTLANEDTGVASRAATNEQGEYTFPLVQPGRYRLTAEGVGFQSMTHTGIVLELGRTSRLDLQLQLGQLAQSVEVSGRAPLLESETSSAGQLIENRTIVDMPLNGRRVGELLGLVGSAVYITGDIIRPRVTMAGGRADQQQWLLDGVNSSNIALEVPQALFNPPVESVQEIRVHENNYSAEFGNTSAGVVAMTTRSGANRFSATAYEYLRNDKLDARNFFAADRPPLRWNVFGVTAGGPIIRNRTFFFSHVEWQRQRVGVTRVMTVPTALERRGDFSQTLTAAGALVRVFDPDTSPRVQFPGNVIPASRIDPVGAKLAALYPLPNRPATNLAGANNFVANAINALNITTWTSKVDHELGRADRLSGRFVLHDFPTYTTAVFEEAAADPNAVINERRAYSLVLNEIHNFTPRVVNDFRFNWQPRYFRNISLGLDQGWPAKLGLKGVSDRAFPRLTLSGYATMGPAQQLRIQTPIHDTHIVDMVSILRGKHAWKIGGEVRLARNVDDLNTFTSGMLAFAVQPTALGSTANTGNALASMLVGFPNSGRILDTDLIDRRAKYVALYFQDDWKVTANFTLNVGLRWETHTPRFDAEDKQNGFDPLAINPVSGTPGVVTFAGRDGVGHNVYDGDYNNFGPRFGFAWRPFGWKDTVVRAGYGVFFGPPLPGSNSASAGFETSGDFSTPDNGITAPFLLRNGFPDTSRTAIGSGFGAVRVGEAVRFAPEFVEHDRRLGYTQQWNLGIQRTLGFDTLLEIAYLANVGHKLNGPNTSINQVPPDRVGAGNAQVRRPFPQFGNVTTIAPMWGNSSYHAANVKLEKRFSHGLNFLGSYTFSKFLDDVTASQEVGSLGSGAQDHYNRRAEKSLAGNDVRNRFVWSSVYELPVGPGRRLVSRGVGSRLVGGWNLGTIVTFQGGAPLGLVTQTNTTNAFNPGAQRVHLLRDPELSRSDRSVERWFDTTAAIAPAQFQFGTAGRANLRSPGYAGVDVALSRNHAWGDGHNVQIRVEAFNVFNRANFDDPGRALGSPTFGVISAAGPARSVQLGLKFTF
jgi:hypothetical protein